VEPLEIRFAETKEIYFVVATEASDNDQLGLFAFDGQEVSFVCVTEIRQAAGRWDQRSTAIFNSIQ
jgi:hypothetical protein